MKSKIYFASKNSFIKILFGVFVLASSFSFCFSQEDPDGPPKNTVDQQFITGEEDGVDPSPVPTFRSNTSTTSNSNKECGGSENYNCYTLLESLEGREEGGRQTTITIEEGGLGTYLEAIFTYFLMLVTIVTVFFMIYGGVMYLTTDIINKKAEGKEIITRAITGIVFVFSVWVIMNSINDGLLRNSLNFSIGGIIDSAKRVVGISATSTNPGNQPPKEVTSTPTSACSSGFEKIQGEIMLCKTVSANMIRLIEDAKKAGVTITLTSGLRSQEKQIELRRQNCGPTNYDIYEKPSRLCRPQTAIPGTSNHEKGVAVDIQEAHTSKGGAGSAAYRWLTQNANKYGFYNNLAVTKEPWHWSINGK